MLSVLLAAAIAIVFFLLVFLSGEGDDASGLTFTQEEALLIESSDSVMRVLTVNDSSDLKVLRDSSICFSPTDLESPLYEKLCSLMIATVTSPGQDGVGIAAPQVGLNRRLVAVQRFDKEGAPFEVYPDIRIENMSGEPAIGPEGCLSVPGYRGDVPRFPMIVISYADTASCRIQTDTVRGFTAVIFQHEVDHLDGILYTDKAVEGSVQPVSE